MQVETAPHSYLDGESPTADSPPHIDNSLSSYTFPQASRRTDARDESLSPDAFRDPLDEHYRRHESSYEITSDGGQSHLPSSHQQPRSMHNFDFEPSSPNREDDEELEEGRDSDDEGEPGETGEDQTEMSELGRTVVSGGPVQRVISTYPFAEYMGSEHQAEHRPGGPPAESSTPYPSQSSTLGFAPPYQPHHPGYPPYPGASYHHPHPHAHPHPHHAFASQSPSYYGRDDEMARQQASTPEGAASESSRSAILPGPRHPASYYTPYQPNSLPASRGAHPVHSDGHYHGRGPYGDPNAEAAYLQHYNASMSAMGGAPQGYAPYGYYASTGSRMAPDELHRMNNMLQREGPLSMHAPNGMPFAGMRSARPATTTRAPRKSASKSSKASTSSGKVRTRVPGTVFHPTPQSMLTEAARRGHISAGALSQRGREGAPPPFPGTSRPGIPTDAEFALMPTKRSRGRRPPISPELVLSEDPNANPSESQIAFCGVTKTGKPKKIFLCKVRCFFFCRAESTRTYFVSSPSGSIVRQVLQTKRASQEARSLDPHRRET